MTNKTSAKMASKLLEYGNLYVEYEHYGNITRSSNNEVLRENFDENMKEFDEVVNERLAEGWQLLGPPTFSLGWCDMQRGGIAIQTLVREKNVELVVVVDVKPHVVVAECVKPLRSSSRIARQNQ
jgi:hypothetical protein